jgi:glutamate racemase
MRTMAPPDDNCTSSAARTILVTDSGLGGLSVFNDIANCLSKGSPWRRVKLVYVNAWPAPHRGYNHFETPERKVRVFDNALKAMAAFHPDVILIACNTLSVIYPHTPFCKAAQIPVEGIVDHGVRMIQEELAADPDSKAVILGTPTTIAAGSHATALVGLGIARNRIINIACTDLAGWIEREPFSETVAQLIRQFVRQTAAALGDFRGRVAAALCCTHFGYRQSLFEAAFTRFIPASVTMLNPNVRMARQVVEAGGPSRAMPAHIDMYIVSKALWTAQQVAAYVKLLPDISTATRNALTGYKLDPELFSVD